MRLQIPHGRAIYSDRLRRMVKASASPAEAWKRIQRARKDKPVILPRTRND